MGKTVRHEENILAEASSPSARKPLLQALAGETGSPPPIWLMRQAGRYLPEYREIRAGVGGFLDLCFNPDLACEVTLQPIRRYGFDAAILFSDILVVPHALGQAVTFKAGEGPMLPPITDADGVDRLTPGGAVERLAPVMETVRRLRAALPAETTLIGFAGAPWTVATYMIEGQGSKDYATVRAFAYRDPALFDRLIGLLVDVTTDYLAAQIAAGAEVVQIFDSWAGVLPAHEFRRWCLKPVAEIARRLKAAHPDVPVIAFPRGAGPLYPEVARLAEIDGVSLDTSLPREFARDAIQPHATVQGNLDPVRLMVGGDDLMRDVDDILATLGTGPMIFNLGHGILQQTPPEHVTALVQRVRGG